MYKYFVVALLSVALFSGYASALEQTGTGQPVGGLYDINTHAGDEIILDFNGISVPEGCVDDFFFEEVGYTSPNTGTFQNKLGLTTPNIINNQVKVFLSVPTQANIGDTYDLAFRFDRHGCTDSNNDDQNLLLGIANLTVVENQQTQNNGIMFVSLDPIPDGERVYSDDDDFSFTVDITSTRYELELDGCNADTLNIPFFDNRSTTCQGCDVTFEADKPDKTSKTDYAVLGLYSNCYDYSFDGEGSSSSSGDCTGISIQPIGTATRGQSLLITTKDQNGNAIAANLILTDSNPETTDQTLITNQPWPGIGSVLIDEAAIEPITILARNEELDCEGQRIITTLQGQLISPDEEEGTNQLIINGLPEEAHIGNLINGTVVDSEGNLVTDKNEIVKIKNPSGSSLKTNTDQNGMFKFYGGELGNYIVKASFSGFKDSDNITVNVRHPRKEITPLVTVNNKQPIDNVLYTGQTVDIGLYEDCVPGQTSCSRISDTVTGTVTNGGSKSKVTFNNGWTSYTLTEEGQLSIVIDQSDNYKQASKTYRVMAGFNPAVFLIPGIFVVVVIVLGVIVKTKGRKGGEDVGQGGFDLPGPEE